MKRVSFKLEDLALAGLIGVGSLAFLLFLSACSENKSNGSPAQTPQNPSMNCTAGQVAHPIYGCLNQQNCAQGQGFYPPQNSCISINTNFNFLAAFQGNLSVSNRHVFELLLRYSKLCDQSYWINLSGWGRAWDFGSARCSAWSSSGFASIRIGQGGIASLQITAGSSAPSYYGYIWNNGLGFTQQTQVFSYNNNLGMLIQGRDIFGSDSGLRGYVESGTLSSTEFDIVWHFQHSEFATSHLKLY